MRPRIAIVAPSLEILGGQAVQAAALLVRLRDSGYDVDFVPISPRFPRGLVFLRGVPYARTILNLALFLPSLVRLRRANVVHVFSASYWSFLLAPVPAMLAARALGKRVVLHYHSGEADDHLARWGALVHPWLHLADEIVVPSAYLRRVFAHYGYQTRVIPNIVDTSLFHFRERAPLLPRLLSNRHLEPMYGVETILEAFALLQPHYPEATLTVVGAGSAERSLRDLARSLGISPEFVGRVQPDATPALYDRSDILVNASLVDNQPVSLLEAFAAGLPIVSTRTGDIPAMLRYGEFGLLVPQADPAAMAKAVASLLEDQGRALAMCRSARREVERYSWPVVSQTWAKVYEDSLEGHTG